MYRLSKIYLGNLKTALMSLCYTRMSVYGALLLYSAAAEQTNKLCRTATITKINTHRQTSIKYVCIERQTRQGVWLWAWSRAGKLCRRWQHSCQ